MAAPAKISVVIAAVNGRECLEECLGAIDRERHGTDAEIIVLNCCRDGTAEYVRRTFPYVKLHDFDTRLSIPHLRAIGMEQATGDVVVVIEDHCLAGDHWFGEIARAAATGYSVMGGAVENGSPDRLTDWAVFFCEYSFSMLPLPTGKADAVSGNNVAYRRDVLATVDETLKRDYWEYFLHAELRKRGETFYSAPSMVVLHKKRFGFGYFMTQRFHYSRSFAGMRRKQLSTKQRLFYLCASPALPLLMLLRIGREVRRKRRFYKEFLLSLPILSVFLVSYAAGEFAGYLCGGGNSLLKVE